MPNLPNKILWVSVKTTAKDPAQSAIVQLGAIVMIDDESMAEFQVNMAPFTGAWIDDKALERTGFSYNKIMDFPPLDEGMDLFLDLLNQHINRFKPKDKFVMAGKSMAWMDSQFIRNYFEYINNKYYGSYFFPICLDIDFLLVRMILEKDMRLKNYNFENVCDYFDIHMPISRPALKDAELKQRLFHRLTTSLDKSDNSHGL